ncbi:MAG: permease prefix domain 1-containing protein [Lachnospiraceae bacterium]|nr:permease prefix domain 1-containing protein [Lachnospiraceae bacterium]
METIKSYLEAMFAGLPNTAEVRKAKAELLQMMEDKYNELIAEGASENAAVGTVISEFGNLDELADDLGLSTALEVAHDISSATPRRNLTLDEVKDYMSARMKKAFLIALGVMLFVICVVFPILITGHGAAGAGMMFVDIAIGVGLVIYGSFVGSEFKYIEQEPCSIDLNTANYLKGERRHFLPIRSICVAVAVVLFIICWVPNLFVSMGLSTLGPALMFLMIGIGVFLLVYSGMISSAFDKLLGVNDAKTVSGTYSEGEGGKRPLRYKNKTAETIVTCYWPAVTSLYLIVSFLTFQWHLTWIIWPIAAVARRAVVMNCEAEE